MVRTTLQVCCSGALGVVLWSSVAVFGQGRPSMEKKESPKRESPKESRPESRKESRPEPRKESRPEPRKESRPEPRREAPRPEPSRNMPRNDGGNRGSSGQGSNREAPGAGRPTFGGGNADGGGRNGNFQSREQTKEQAELNRLEDLRRHKERDEQERIEREREEREEAEFKEKQRLEAQRLAELRLEIERLEAIDRALAAERRQELRDRETKWRDREDARQRTRELDRLRRANQDAGRIVPAPPIAPAKPARAVAAAKPVKPIEPRPEPLNAEQLAAALRDLGSGDLKQELAALARLAKAAADENRVKVAKAIEPHLNKADPVKFKAAAKALAVWSSADQVPRLLELLPELDKAARHDAIATFGTLKDVRAIVPLVELLTVPVDRHAAVEALTAIGPKAAPHVMKQLAHDEFWVRAAAVDVLAEVGDAESTDVLKKLAEDDPEGFVRNKASNAVRQLGG